MHTRLRITGRDMAHEATAMSPQTDLADLYSTDQAAAQGVVACRSADLERGNAVLVNGGSCQRVLIELAGYVEANNKQEKTKRHDRRARASARHPPPSDMAWYCPPLQLSHQVPALR